MRVGYVLSCGHDLLILLDFARICKKKIQNKNKKITVQNKKYAEDEKAVI